MLIKNLREAPFWDRCFAIVVSLAGVESAHAKRYDREVFAA